VDISRDEIQTGRGFLTQRMISDENLGKDITGSETLRPYSGKYDSLAELRQRQYPGFEPQPALEAVGAQ
jgi:nitrogenase molybdenum-iron protein alpha chain